MAMRTTNASPAALARCSTAAPMAAGTGEPALATTCQVPRMAQKGTTVRRAGRGTGNGASGRGPYREQVNDGVA